MSFIQHLKFNIQNKRPAIQQKPRPTYILCFNLPV
jgi:hypothetical protein